MIVQQHDNDDDWEDEEDFPNKENKIPVKTIKVNAMAAKEDPKGRFNKDGEELKEEDIDVTTASSSSIAKARPNTVDCGEDDETQQKKKKKRANQRNLAKIKEARKAFMERCVSPTYDQTNDKQYNG